MKTTPKKLDDGNRFITQLFYQNLGRIQRIYQTLFDTVYLLPRCTFSTWERVIKKKSCSFELNANSGLTPKIELKTIEKMASVRRIGGGGLK